MNSIHNRHQSLAAATQSEDKALPHAAKEAICREIVERCLSAWGDRILAVVLTGSLARNEATFIRRGERRKLLGDADCFIVFRKTDALPAEAEAESLQVTIETSLAQEGLTAKVGLSCVSPRFLGGLPSLISVYELRECGEVLWGDGGILSLVPSFSAHDLSCEDAWRMLCNRMIEQLAYVNDLSASSVALTLGLHYATVKLFLDMGTSFLVFAGHYAPSFRERSQRLLLLAENPHCNAPFPLKKFATRVAELTEWKISGEGRDCNRSIELWHEAIGYMRRLWRWEMIQLTDAPRDLTIGGYISKLAKQQAAKQRIRGWLSVARRRGSLKSWRSWARWMRLYFNSSPRYLIYRAAAEVAFRLPCLIKSADRPRRLDVDWRAIQSHLPELAPRLNADREITWRELTNDVLWNYSEFLLSTRA